MSRFRMYTLDVYLPRDLSCRYLIFKRGRLPSTQIAALERTLLKYFHLVLSYRISGLGYASNDFDGWLPKNTPRKLT